LGALEQNPLKCLSKAWNGWVRECKGLRLKLGLGFHACYARFAMPINMFVHVRPIKMFF